MTAIEVAALIALALALAAVVDARRSRRRARAAVDAHEAEAAQAAEAAAVPPADEAFRDLVEAVHEAVLVHGAQIVLVNARFATMLGMEPAAAVGRSLAELVASDYTALVGDNVRRRLAGEPAAAERPSSALFRAGRR